MKSLNTLSCLCITFLLLFLPAASGYSFQGQDPAQDSARLVLNGQESAGDIVALDVELYGVPGISSGGFYLYFNSSVLKWAGIFTHDPDGYVEGDFFGDSALYSIGPLYKLDNTRNDSVLLAGVTGDFKNPVSGSGTMITMKFRITGTGTTDLVFYNNRLKFPDLSQTDSQWFGGTFSTGEVPVQEPEQDDPPVVTLVTPDSGVYASGDVELSCHFSDDYGLSQISLYTNITGPWTPYRTVDVDQRIWLETFYLEGLQEGIYRWNCRAVDTESQGSFAGIDHVFAVQFPQDHTPPEILNSGFTGNLTSMDDLVLVIETDEPATCRYSIAPETPFKSMGLNFSETGATSHSAPLPGIQNNTEYYFYVRCRDLQGNMNQEDEIINFSTGTVQSDVQAPVILSASPNGSVDAGHGFSYLAVNTNENSECRYSETGGLGFESMTPFTVTHSTNHSVTISVLRATEYTYYIKCRDEGGNENTDAQVSFFVCYEADSDCSRAVEMAELMNFIDRWYMDNRDVRMRKVMEAVGLWKAGSA